MAAPLSIFPGSSVLRNRYSHMLSDSTILSASSENVAPGSVSSVGHRTFLEAWPWDHCPKLPVVFPAPYPVLNHRMISISCSETWLWCVFSLSRGWLFVTPWAVACQASLSKESSRQEYWSELSFPSPGDLPDSGMEPGSPVLQVESLPSEPPGNTTWHWKGRNYWYMHKLDKFQKL